MFNLNMESIRSRFVLFKKNKYNLKNILFASICLPLLLYITLPLQSFFANRLEFSCTWQDIVLLGLSYFSLVAIILILLSAIFLIVNNSLGRIFISILAIISVLILLESGPFSYGLPQIDGNFTGYMFSWRTVVDAIVWILLISLSILYGKHIFKYVPVISLSCIILSVLNVFLSLNTVDLRHLPTLKIQDVVQVAGFNKNNNTLILSIDMAHAKVVQEIVAKNSKVRDGLAGFTNFVNNLTMHEQTIHSVPSILHGQHYNGFDIYSYKAKVFTSKSSLVKKHMDDGYAIFLCMTPPLSPYTNQNVNQNINRTEEIVEGLFYATGVCPWYIHDFVLFRILPLSLKKVFADEIQNPVTNNIKNKHLSLREHDFYYRLSSNIENQYSKPTFHAYHTTGAHYPFYMDSKGKTIDSKLESGDLEAYEAQLTAVLNVIVDFLNLLRSHGIYDNSTIVFISDHGYEYYPVESNDGIPGRFTPMLMIKPKNAKNMYKESSFPMSSSFVPELVAKLIDSNDPYNDMDKFLADFPKTRIVRTVNDESFYVDYFFDEFNKNYSKVTKAISQDKDLERWMIDKTYSSTNILNTPEIPKSYTRGINHNGSMGYEMVSGSSGEMHLLLPKEIKKCDIQLRLFSTMVGELTVTNQLNGKNQLIALKGAPDNFTRVESIIKDIDIPEDGIVRFKFDVKGESGHMKKMAFAEWKIIKTPEAP